MASKTATQPKPTEKAEAPDWLKALLAELKEQGLKVTVKAAPNGKHVRLLLKEGNIAFVDKQTRNGLRVKPKATVADLKGKAKGFKPEKHGGSFASQLVVSKEAELKEAVAALQVAAEKVKAEKAEKPKAQPAKKAQPKAEAKKEEAPAQEPPAATEEKEEASA